MAADIIFNWTNVELKPLWNRMDMVNRSFLIEPMWNWNSLVPVADVLPVVFLIEPMWNWNSQNGQYFIDSHVLFNWTNVELKLRPTMLNPILVLTF